MSGGGSTGRKLASRLVQGLGLQGLVFRWRERRMAAGVSEIQTGSDGKPLPPALLRVMVCGTADPDYFLESGQETVAEFDAAFRATGGGLAEARAVLDLGCGCGRLARWAPVDGARLAGIDIEKRLVGWCAGNLPGRYETVKLGAPLPAPDGAFDVIYACSVITHLRLETARSWLAEVARVLEPGGRALVTYHDERHPNAAPVRGELGREGWAVRFDSLEGSNHLASFVTAGRLAELAGAALEVVQVTPSDQTFCKQAIAVLRKPA